ncbi:DUF3769 domain-containing protein [Synechococcus sp. CS-1324]|nr:DUF3769 domain-containing protein [Synechococcus sp. CS-1324]
MGGCSGSAVPPANPIPWTIGLIGTASLLGCWGPVQALPLADDPASIELEAEAPSPQPSEPQPSQLQPAAPQPSPPQPLPPPPAPAPASTPTPSPDPAPPQFLEISADQQGFDQLIQRYVATGNVQAAVAGGRLLAERLEYDTTNRTVYASGSVRFARGAQAFQASRLRFSLIEATGELEDVYGVLDLSTSELDLNPELPPSLPLPPPEPIACPPALPPIPDWHPHPWAGTLWGGQLFDANFGDTFLFNGQFRQETLVGAGLQRRVWRSGPFAVELDFNALGHWASAQKGSGFSGRFTRGDSSGLDTAAQGFGEFTAGIGLRAWLRPWLSLGVVQGVSLLTSPSNFESTYRDRSSQLLNYLGFEVEAAVSPQWSLVGRIHHRSGAFGTYNGVNEGSNAYLLGLRHRFGAAPASKPSPQAAMLPAKGCANRGAEPPDRPRSLSEALEQTAMGGEAPDPVPPLAPATQLPAPAAATASPPGRSFAELRQQERAREAAIATVEQRVTDVQAREGLRSERRFGLPGGTDLTDTQQNNDFGPASPPQVRRLRGLNNQGLVQGTLTRLRFQAPRITITRSGWRATRASFSNDPFTPAQVWMDADDVVAVQEKNGDIVIRSNRNRLKFEDRLSIPVTTRTRIRKEQEVENRWVLGSDQRDRDGFYIGRRLKPIGIGARGILQLEPQFLLERAYQGTTDSYPLPGTSAGSSTVQQNTTLADLFGLEARLSMPLLGFETDFNLDISTFNPDNIANGTRSWADLRRSLRLPLVGDTVARLFAAYRFRIWNGSLGEQDVYSAYGTSLEQKGVLPAWGRLYNSYFWRVGVGNYQSNTFVNGSEQDNFAQLWRANAYGAINSSIPLWTGTALPSTRDAALRYSPVPIVPGLTINTNLSANLAYFGDGTNQNVLSFSGGPTLTLGHFSKPFLDFTQLTITGGIGVRQGQSPFGFDQAVDLGTVGIGLTQQLAGPLLFNGGIGLNVDGSSPNYGDVTGSFVELRWQRRAYSFSVYYSPYEGLGGVRVTLGDFGFKGTGVPFVPYQPVTPGQPRGGLF